MALRRLPGVSAAGPQEVPALQRWHLSDDRRSLIAEWQYPQGILTATVGWPHAATDTEVDAALQPRQFTIQPGERRYARRWVAGPVTLWLHVSGGPPTWWWPRLFPHKGALVCGWLRRAYAVKVARTRRAG